MFHRYHNITPIVPPYYEEIDYASRWILYGFSVGEDNAIPFISGFFIKTRLVL